MNLRAENLEAQSTNLKDTEFILGKPFREKTLATQTDYLFFIRTTEYYKASWA